eukprot:31264-Pelagococcus_subviridis.AAC.13
MIRSKRKGGRRGKKSGASLGRCRHSRPPEGSSSRSPSLPPASPPPPSPRRRRRRLCPRTKRQGRGRRSRPLAHETRDNATARARAYERTSGPRGGYRAYSRPCRACSPRSRR